MDQQLRILGLDPEDPTGVEAHAGPNNMAWDEALLRGDHPATLRLYRWSPHTVSLGYFQEHGRFVGLDGTPEIVRRQTGGGAIWHGDELTFALACDASVLPQDLLASYRLIHKAVAEALEAVGCATVVAPGGAAPHPRHSDPWCFAEIACGDLLLPGEPRRKLVGSAQRRIRLPLAQKPQRERVLHHGSIPLTQPPRPSGNCGVIDGMEGSTPHGPALCRSLAGPMVTRLGAALGLTPSTETSTDSEAAMAGSLVAERYGAAEFTQRR